MLHYHSRTRRNRLQRILIGIDFYHNEMAACSSCKLGCFCCSSSLWWEFLTVVHYWLCPWMFLLLDWNFAFLHFDTFFVQCHGIIDNVFILNLIFKPFQCFFFFLFLRISLIFLSNYEHKQLQNTMFRAEPGKKIKTALIYYEQFKVNWFEPVCIIYTWDN